MSWDQIKALLQTVLMFAGGFAVARGWLDTEQLQMIVGGLITILGTLWAIRANSKSSLITSAANIPEVKSIEMDKTLPGTPDLLSNTPTNVK